MSGSLAGEGAASVEGGRGAMPAPMPSRVGTARHTTGQKRADEELRVANERLEEAQRVAHLGSWELDPHMDKITASAEFFRLFDAAPAEIARYAQFVERLHPDDRERVNRDVAAALEEDRPYDTEYRVKLRDGGWRDINARGHVVTDADGKPAWFVGTCLDITERKRAAEELRLSQAMYKTIVDNIPQKVFVKGPDLRWASVNGPLARDFGLRPEDVVGKTNRELFPQDLADKYSADDQRIVGTGATEEFDEEYLDKGERRFVHTIKTPVRDEAGTIQGVFGMFRDVTEEKRAEQRLRVANERLEEAQRVAHLGSWEWDPAGDQITGSAEFFRLFDAAPEEIVRYQQFVERLHPDDREHVDRDVAAALEGNRSYDTEYRVRLRDGGWRDINARGRLVTDPDGKPVRFVGTCLDITERKRAEGALRESERWYRTLAISLPHLVWTCRADGPCDYLSPRWVEYTGIPESEQLGYRWLEQLHPDDRDRVIAEWTEVAAHGESFDIEFRIRRADGVHRWFKTRAIPLRDNNGQLVKWFGSNTDIDDVKRASEVLAAVNAELEDRVKARTAALEAANRELEAFSYSVSHDLRAPLRSVDGFSKILLQDHGEQLDAEARRVLGVVIRNVQQMGRLIDDLLAFSRVSRKELERQPVDMGKLARAVAEVLRAAEPERAIEVDIGSLGGTLGDSGLLRQVWVNLLGNAFKFTRPADRPRIEIRCEQVDGECRYTVRDNGVGFDPAYADNLFKPFQRLHPTAEFEGTGIGLAIVARIVQRHGGRVSAEGRPGAGATFGFSLPTSKEDT